MTESPAPDLLTGHAKLRNSEIPNDNEQRTTDFGQFLPRPPIEDFQLHRAVSLNSLICGAQAGREAARAGAVADVPKHGFEDILVVGDPKFGVFFKPHALRPGMGDIAQENVDRRIADAGLLSWSSSSRRRSVVRNDLGVQAQATLELLRLERAAGDLVQTGAEGVDIARLDGHRRPWRGRRGAPAVVALPERPARSKPSMLRPDPRHSSPSPPVIMVGR